MLRRGRNIWIEIFEVYPPEAEAAPLAYDNGN